MPWLGDDWRARIDDARRLAGFVGNMAAEEDTRVAGGLARSRRGLADASRGARGDRPAPHDQTCPMQPQDPCRTRASMLDDVPERDQNAQCSEPTIAWSAPTA
jgi:hypothetical protein